jgi:hypothetical protein
MTEFKDLFITINEPIVDIDKGGDTGKLGPVILEPKPQRLPYAVMTPMVYESNLQSKGMALKRFVLDNGMLFTSYADVLRDPSFNCVEVDVKEIKN